MLAILCAKGKLRDEDFLCQIDVLVVLVDCNQLPDSLYLQYFIHIIAPLQYTLSGVRFTKGKIAFPNLAKSRSCEISSRSYLQALKFDRSFHSSTAEPAVESLCHPKTIFTNL